MQKSSAGSEKINSPVVVIYRPVSGAEASHDELRSLGCEVVTEPIDKPEAAPSDLARLANVLMGATFRGGVMDAAWFEQFPQLRLVSKYTIGYDDVDLDEATRRGIAVTHCPTEANWGGVAEGAMAMLLALTKRLNARDAAVKSGGWRDPAFEGRYVGAREDGYAGLTIGIIGFGRVGGRLAELLRPWRARVLACDPYVDQARFDAHDACPADLDSLLRESDIVSVHCALTSQTRGMLNAERLALMKENSILINTARGGVMDYEALLAGLEKGRPAGAALDVFPEEPIANFKQLREFGDRLLLSPHMVSANQGGTLGPAVPWATEAVIRALQGEFPDRVVNPEVRKTWIQKFGEVSLTEAGSARK